MLDCANGAAGEVAPAVFQRLGADVIVINDHPDGCNINDRCGATHPENLRLAVVAEGADAGLAFDGDADRLIAVDHTGAVVDGDHIIAICARDLHARGALRDDTVVVTVMTNLGFRLAMADAGITVVETPVGDRYVLGALDRGRWSAGRRAERPRDLPRPRHHRRRHAHRPAAARRRGPHRAPARRPRGVAP